jgi:hypothetical protein
MGTPEFEQSSDERKKVEMRFAHLKTHHRFERMRLRGLSGARDELSVGREVVWSRSWRDPLDPEDVRIARPKGCSV